MLHASCLRRHILLHGGHWLHVAWIYMLKEDRYPKFIFITTIYLQHILPSQFFTSSVPHMANFPFEVASKVLTYYRLLSAPLQAAPCLERLIYSLENFWLNLGSTHTMTYRIISSWRLLLGNFMLIKNIVESTSLYHTLPKLLPEWRYSTASATELRPKNCFGSIETCKNSRHWAQIKSPYL